MDRLSTQRRATVLLVAVATAAFSARANASEPRPEATRLRTHVTTLASPEFLGRRGEGGRKAAEYLIQQFQSLHLDPLFDHKYTQEFPAGPETDEKARNVGAVLKGADPKYADEWIIVSAHFDHLGVRNGVLYPGADDNASGVAMLLEVARSIVEGKVKPRRSIMFIGFDLEEVGLYGSRYFAEHSPVPLNRVALFVTADMIGRSLAGLDDPHVFVMGTEHAPGLRTWIEAAAEGSTVQVGVLGADVLLIDRSDYGPFRSRKVPFLFFSTGENPLYHRPGDTAETLDYAKVEAISRIILGVVREAANADAVPKWKVAAENSMAEVNTVREVIRLLLKNRETLKIGPAKVYLMNNSLRTLDAIAARGSITPEERTGMVRAAQFILASVF